MASSVGVSRLEIAILDKRRSERRYGSRSRPAGDAAKTTAGWLWTRSHSGGPTVEHRFDRLGRNFNDQRIDALGLPLAFGRTDDEMVGEWSR